MLGTLKSMADKNSIDFSLLNLVAFHCLWVLIILWHV